MAKEYNFNISVSVPSLTFKFSSPPILKQKEPEKGDVILDDSGVNHYPPDWGEVEEPENVIRQSEEKGYKI
jgi:hypothetical protein